MTTLLSSKVVDLPLDTPQRPIDFTIHNEAITEISRLLWAASANNRLTKNKNKQTNKNKKTRRKNLEIYR